MYPNTSKIKHTQWNTVSQQSSKHLRRLILSEMYTLCLEIMMLILAKDSRQPPTQAHTTAQGFHVFSWLSLKKRTFSGNFFLHVRYFCTLFTTRWISTSTFFNATDFECKKFCNNRFWTSFNELKIRFLLSLLLENDNFSGCAWVLKRLIWK